MSKSHLALAARLAELAGTTNGAPKARSLEDRVEQLAIEHDDAMERAVERAKGQQ
jgi:hypothetical protein